MNGFEKVWAEAVAAGDAAAKAAVPEVMVLVGGGGQRYVVPEGPCGFAWVNVSPGNSAFAKWLKAKGLAHKAYRGGVDAWCSGYGQSMDRKSAWAYAVAKVLQKAGVNATPQSRMD